MTHYKNKMFSQKKPFNCTVLLVSSIPRTTTAVYPFSPVVYFNIFSGRKLLIWKQP